MAKTNTTLSAIRTSSGLTTAGARAATAKNNGVAIVKQNKANARKARAQDGQNDDRTRHWVSDGRGGKVHVGRGGTLNDFKDSSHGGGVRIDGAYQSAGSRGALTRRINRRNR